MKGFKKIIITAFSMSAFLGTTNADPISTTFAVTAQIEQECELVTGPGPVAFGDYIATNDKPANTLFKISCTTGTTYNMALNYGLNNVTTQRNMIITAPGTSLLAYNLYKDAGYSNSWGNAGTDIQTGTGTGSAQTYYIYGKIPAGQFSPIAGNYTDTITLDVTY